MQVVQIVLWYFDSGCSKHTIGDRSWLRNFVKKFIETVKFGNDHFGAIMGYKDYVIDLGKLQPTADIGIFVGYAPSRKGPTPSFLMPGLISSGLIPNSVPAAPYVPLTDKELEILFQPMFDEYLDPPCVERPVSPATVVQVPVNSTGTPSSTTIDQDAPSPSHSPSSLKLQPPILHQDKMADENIPAPVPIRSNDQILSFDAWVPTKKGRKDKPHIIPYYRFLNLIICHLGRTHNIHQRATSSFHLAEEDLRLGNLKFVPKGKDDEVFGMPIPNKLISINIRKAPYYNAYLEMVAKYNNP
nr:integrase, catalytic region, zinc finger, CCHC-type, peptidase aspartic, catalytic [Tanacetum cinerariifolium]